MKLLTEIKGDVLHAAHIKCKKLYIFILLRCSFILFIISSLSFSMYESCFDKLSSANNH